MRINGWILFAGIMMVVMGTMSAINGLIAIFKDEVYVVTDENIVAFDFTVWGIIHLIVGVIVVLAAFALLRGETWARFVAAILAGLAIVAQVGTIQYYPFWAIAMIAISVTVIYAVCTMGRADEEVEIPMQM
jgi:hypothetical protein